MLVCLLKKLFDLQIPFLYLGGMVFIAIPFLSYDGPAETDGK
jgi:hypothetical protein